MTTIVRNAGSATEKSDEVDLADAADHQRADDDQRRRGRLDRDHLVERGEEHRGEEEQAGDDVGEPGAGALARCPTRTRRTPCWSSPTPRRPPRRRHPRPRARGRCSAAGRRSSSSPAWRPSPVIVPIASKKLASTSVKTSSVTASAGSRANAPNETSPTSERSGSETIDSGIAGVAEVPALRVRAVGRADGDDGLDHDRDHGRGEHPDEDPGAHPAGDQHAGEQQPDARTPRWARRRSSPRCRARPARSCWRRPAGGARTRRRRTR